MDKEIEKIIDEIMSNKEVDDAWILDICDRISKILGNDNISEKLKEHLLEYCDSLFMMRNAILNL